MKIHSPSVFSLWLLVLSIILKLYQSIEYRLKEENITLILDNSGPFLNLTINVTSNISNVENIKSISLKLNNVLERFPNNLTRSFNLTNKFFFESVDTSFTEQEVVDARKTVLKLNSVESLKDVNFPNVQFNYLFFNDTAWIDENTNYVRDGNLMMEIQIRNFTFCEDVVNRFNSFVDKKDPIAIALLNITKYSECFSNWDFDINTKKYIEKTNPLKWNSTTNISYLEFYFDVNLPEKGDIIYNSESSVLRNLTNDYSYLRLYKEIKNDGEDAYMTEGYPLVQSNKKSIVFQIPKFSVSSESWLFLDMQYTPPPPNFKNLSTIIFIIIVVGLILVIFAVLIRRKMLKEQLTLEENQQNLNSI